MRIVEDIKAFSGDKKIKIITTVLINPCFHAVLNYRISNFFYKHHLILFSKIIWYLNRVLFSVDIDYKANLAGGLVLVHGLGIVIGQSVVTTGPIKIYQNVTLGGGSSKIRYDEKGEEKMMPIFGPHCVVYAGAIVVGGITIKEKTIIKAGTIINYDIL